MLKRLFMICLVIIVVSSELEPIKQVDDVDGYCEASGSGISYSSLFFVGLFSSLVFCFIGILPAFFIRTDADEQKFKNSLIFKLLLAFAAGSLLSEVFLHLIPEASHGDEKSKINNGLCSILAFFTFLLIEKITNLIPNMHALGTLNLIANFFDNSAHGTTVVGAFQVSFKFGMIALIATIIHEVPHEFSDFALLLRDGYTRKRAIFFQVITAMAGTIGATISYILTTPDYTCTSLNTTVEHHSHHHGSIALPFTIGGFIYISLVGIVPEIVEETDRKTSIFQLIAFISGVVFIYLLVQIESNLL